MRGKQAVQDHPRHEEGARLTLDDQSLLLTSRTHCWHSQHVSVLSKILKHNISHSSQPRVDIYRDLQRSWCEFPRLCSLIRVTFSVLSSIHWYLKSEETWVLVKRCWKRLQRFWVVAVERRQLKLSMTKVGSEWAWGVCNCQLQFSSCFPRICSCHFGEQ